MAALQTPPRFEIVTSRRDASAAGGLEGEICPPPIGTALADPTQNVELPVIERSIQYHPEISWAAVSCPAAARPVLGAAVAALLVVSEQLATLGE